MGYTLRNTYKYQGVYYGPGDDVEVPLGLVKALNLKEFVPPEPEAEPEEELFVARHAGGGWYEIFEKDGSGEGEQKIDRVRGKDAADSRILQLKQKRDAGSAVLELQRAMPISEDKENAPVEQLDLESRAPYRRPTEYATESELNSYLGIDQESESAASEEPQEAPEEDEPSADTLEDSAPTETDSEREERKDIEA